MPCLSSVVLIYLEILKRLACFSFLRPLMYTSACSLVVSKMAERVELHVATMELSTLSPNHIWFVIPYKIVWEIPLLQLCQV